MATGSKRPGKTRPDATGPAKPPKTPPKAGGTISPRGTAKPVKTKVAARSTKPPRGEPAVEAENSAPRLAPGVPIIGIVASAGGLEAFVKFLKAMPADCGMALVFVPHLDPSHASLMCEVLVRHTGMPVTQVEHGERFLPNHVYVIPPNKYLEVRDATAILSGPVQRGTPFNPIDQFLSSLASDQQDRAVAIVLSGTSKLGTIGAMSVKSNGGMVMAQLPESADQPSMPQGVVDSGLADYVLAPEELPKALLGFAARFFGSMPESGKEADSSGPLSEVISLLRAHSRYDFLAYRKPMLIRRIRRRMGIKNQQGMDQYVALLRDDPDELKLLTRDLLISVTQFFRDPEMFRELQAQVIPELLRNRSEEHPLRVWVPACATGEEAYSICMLLLEAIAASGMACPLQMFATDIDADALDVARRGIYAEALLTQIAPERLARFFSRVDAHSYQVAKPLRDTVLFAQHNLLSDVPFSKVDLVSCRNLLIYIEAPAQQKIISLLHFALNEGGYLVLGPAESAGMRQDMFEPVSKKWRIYRRSWMERRPRIDFPIAPVAERPEVRGHRAAAGVREPNLGELMREALLQEFAPCAALIRHDYGVLYFHGPTAPYFIQPSGRPTNDLTALVGEGLRSRVRAAVHKAIKENQRVTMVGARVKRGRRFVGVRVNAMPLPAKTGLEGLVIVTFEDELPPAKAASGHGQPSLRQENIVSQLEDELKRTREELRGTIEDLESTNEELTGSNEEMMSMNEELQSANEELESSKEEMQSLNEELTTVNAQLQEKIGAVEEVSNDLSNLLASIDVATIFLDADLRIKRFSAAATRVLRLIPTDVGRPIGDIKGFVADAGLDTDVKSVLETLVPLEKELTTDNGRCYLRRITPYRTGDNRIEGVVLTFTDVSTKNESSLELGRRNLSLERDVADSAARLSSERTSNQAALNAIEPLVIVLDAQAHMIRFNHTCEQASGYTANEATGKTPWELGLIPADEEPAARNRVLAGLRGEVVERHEGHWRRRDGTLRSISWSILGLTGAAGKVEYLIGTGLDLAAVR